VFGLEIWIFYTFLSAIFALRDKKTSSWAKAAFFLAISLGGTFFFNYLRGKAALYFGVNLFPDRKRFINDTITFYIQFSFYATGYFFAYRYNLKQKQLWELEKKQAEYEKAQAVLEFNNARLQADLMHSENNFLRSQINPHFLYNCLNFMYSKTFRQQPEVADAIMVLSQVMRYSLTDFSVAKGLANLDEEILHISNVIRINGFRFNDSLQVRLEVEGNPSNKMITPMLLITLVENVFKHGQLQDKQSPAVLMCQIDEQQKRLRFTTRNRKSEITPANLSFGVGHSNIRQRLSMLYKDDFSLTVKEESGIYEVVLDMPYFDALPNANKNNM